MKRTIFKTAFEIDQRWVVDLAADRAPVYLPRSQSVNVFLPGDVDKWDLHMLHWTAWEKGVKSLYYCRSKSVQRAAYAGGETKKATDKDYHADNRDVAESEIEANLRAAAEARTDYDECLACQ